MEMADTFQQRCREWLDAADASTDEYEIVAGLLDVLAQIADIFHDGSSPDGWDIAIMSDVAALMTAHGFASRGPGFVDPDKWCWDGVHSGPIVVSGTEPIDNGIGIFLRCETCGAGTDTSIDLDDIGWEEE
jgi:hypothetical protein